MASIIPGFEYDIFISYRQKDNKSDRWVSEFVDALKNELGSTFKEEISVYFDINPNDGLLETHDVDASLKDKLNCLIFIPIISHTYCDPKSFAWEHEFKTFVEQASQDQFGLKIRLPTGNVANRVLPVHIHDLDITDIKLCESILGGVLRGVEFIYKSSGVNRPLRSKEESPSDNLNKTFYVNQINKVANAIKEIITAIGQYIPRKDEISKEDYNPIFVTRKNNKTKILVGSVIVLVLIVFAYFLITNLSKPKEELEKSIAVLPFRNDSSSDSTTYFINGLMEEVLNNLQKIRDFRVLSRTSTEQYRGTAIPPIPKIAKNLGVNYIIEGEGQKYGNKFVLRVQLIAADKEKHIWGKSYKQEIHETTDIIYVQSQIAQSIAEELNATITPEEKQLINKIPTTNLTAFDFYHQGREEHTKYWVDNGNKTALQNAEDFYHKSLKYDSKFAPAYSGLARVYWDKHVSKEKEFFSKNFMDSVLILTKIALSFDDQLSEVYTLRGRYYSETGKPEQAIEEFDKAIKLNPNDWMAYREKGEFYYNIDLVNTINYLQKAASINHGQELSGLLGDIGEACAGAGFPDKAKEYYQDKLKLDGDSLSYFTALAGIEFFFENFNKSIEYAEKGFMIDSTYEDILFNLGHNYAWLGKYKESLKYYKKYFEKMKAKGEIYTGYMHRLGYAYWQNGYKEEAENCFDEQIKYCNNSIALKRAYAQLLYAYYDLAGVYAFRGEKEKAYINLRIFDQIQRMPLWMGMIMLIKTDPLFASIRNEPEFQKIVKDVETRNQAEHERVRKWLEEQGML